MLKRPTFGQDGRESDFLFGWGLVSLPRTLQITPVESTRPHSGSWPEETLPLLYVEQKRVSNGSPELPSSQAWCGEIVTHGPLCPSVMGSNQGGKKYPSPTHVSSASP